MLSLYRALLCAAMLIFCGQSWGQEWPVRPIKLIVSTGPGLATDIMARLMSERISRRLGQQVYVENIPGGSGMIGAQAAARSAPDGYTYYFAPSSALSANTVLYKSVPYEPLRDFTPVAMVCDSSPFVLSVQPELPIKTLPELIAYAKSNPGKMSYAIDTSSGLQLAIGQLLTKRAALDWVQVPYRSTPQMMQDTSTGVVQMMISSVTAVQAFAAAGKVRTIAISSEKRFPGLDDLPTIAEVFPGFNIDGWFVVVAPAGTPAPYVERLNAAIGEFLKEPDVAPRLRQFGLASSGAGTPRSTGEFIAAELNRWVALAKELDIKPQ
jgi:tripartite-type tricarboxylate transporter receptor subunit TctC